MGREPAQHVSEGQNDIDARRDLVPELLRLPDLGRATSDEDLRAAFEARSVIDVAVGITMGNQDCRREAARALLLRTSRAFDITVLELARAVIASTG